MKIYAENKKLKESGPVKVTPDEALSLIRMLQQREGKSVTWINWGNGSPGFWGQADPKMLRSFTLEIDDRFKRLNVHNGSSQFLLSLTVMKELQFDHGKDLLFGYFGDLPVSVFFG